MDHRSPRPGHAARLAIVALTFALGGCSNDDAAPTTSETSSTPDSTPTTPSAPSSTTSNPTTSNPTTSNPTTSNPKTSTSAGTTDPDEPLVGIDDPEIQAMVAGLRRHIDAMIAAGEQPTDDTLLAAALATATGEGRDFVQRFVDILRRDGYAIRHNRALPSRVELIEETATVVGDAGGIDVCDIDGDVLVEVGGNDDGSDRVIDDDLQSNYVSYRLIEVDGEWLVSKRDTVAEHPDREGCE